MSPSSSGLLTNGANPLTPYQDSVANIATVVGAFAIGVGVISLLQLHTRAVARQRPGWGNSVVLIVMFLLMLVFGLLNDYAPHLHVAWVRRDFQWTCSTFCSRAAWLISARRHFP